MDDRVKADWHDQAIWFVRQKRDHETHGIPEWEELRELGSQIKSHTLSRLDHYLEIFEKNARKHGVHVHWASTAEKHNEIILDILKRNTIRHVVKSKSMLTEECRLNPYLESNGIEIIDTDLGERIIQLRGETPSHIVLPAIHLKKEEVGELFSEKLGTEAGANDPTYLTEAARIHLRSKFLEAGAAITGVNFAVADSGAVVVCTNEGNADMGVHAAPVQIHSMGIEKVIPRTEDLGVFTRLLARSATGQPVTIFNAHYLKPKPGGEMHVIIVDNGRSEHLGRKHFRNGLKCIRCGACLNTCPVYRRSGGHSYNSTIAGPIGSVLTPGFDLEKHSDLPFASTLCGSCSDVCPVKIDLHEQLYRWRQIISKQSSYSKSKKMIMRLAGNVLANPKRMHLAGKFARRMIGLLPRGLIYLPANKWGAGREMPEPPARTFKQWYRDNRMKYGQKDNS